MASTCRTCNAIVSLLQGQIQILMRQASRFSAHLECNISRIRVPAPVASLNSYTLLLGFGVFGVSVADKSKIGNHIGRACKAPGAAPLRGFPSPESPDFCH